ncbi:DUF1007 family protein [Rhizobium sp. DKSPLA3]|uniref:DUF1007 family protein n=1 Tax=Rhizobium quercicola TaxID=2901226 RepID=A0A9X1NVM7_9HYPH|nr:DUF1007 family protein [Rhizobium quercicola]MCD7111230.1 DUF1007 family protein [Rhizobium quercicola]
MRRTLSSRGLLAGLAAAFVLPAQAFAHPHIFAEARLEVVSDDTGHISQLRNVWRFDELFSASVLLDFDKNSNATLDPDELAEVGQTVLDSLSEYNYYTTIYDNGKLVKVSKPDAIHADFKDNQLLLIFAVKPAEAMPLKGTMSFGIYDPTLYTAIDFPSDGDLAVVGTKLAACKHKVVRPDPDEVISQNQSSLTDAFFTDPTGTDMSKLFATRIEFTC